MKVGSLNFGGRVKEIRKMVYMKFIAGRRYWTEGGGYEMFVVNRFDRIGRIRAEIGFGLPANYKVRVDILGREYIVAKGRRYESFP
jgi:hypothetical protein